MRRILFCQTFCADVLAHHTLNANLSWSACHRYLERYTLPMPGRLTDLIAGDEDAVMPGEKCQLGAGCVNGARPVLRGFGCTIGQGSNIGTPQRRNPWQQGKIKCILNPRGTLLLAHSRGGYRFANGQSLAAVSVNAVVRPIKLARLTSIDS